MKIFFGPGYFAGMFFIFLGASGVAFCLYGIYIYEQTWIVLLFFTLFCWWTYSATREFIFWFRRLPQKRLLVDDSIILIDGKKFRYDEIITIKTWAKILKKFVNFLPAGRGYTALAEMMFANGDVYRFRAGEGSFVTFRAFGSSIGAADSKALIVKIELISTISGVPLQTLESEQSDR